MDILERLHHRNHPYGYLTLIDDAAKEIVRLRAALQRIAALDDVGANKRLTKTGSYGSFDEPNSVEIARKALEDPQ